MEDRPAKGAVTVKRLKIIAIGLEQSGPVKTLRNRRLLAPRRPALLVGHFEEKQERELLDVVAIGQAVIPQDVAVIPELYWTRAEAVIDRLF